MLTFTQSITANQSFHGDPDFIITVDGVDITPLVTSWRLTDGEEGAGEITVTLYNQGMSIGGSFGYGQKLEMRFGYQGQLSPKASVDIVKISEAYTTGSGVTITLSGRDDMYKMTGGSKRGTLKQGESGDSKIKGKKALEQVIKDINLKPQVTAPNDTEYRAPSFMNENPYQAARRLLGGMAAE